MKAFGQQASFKKTEVMTVKSDRKKRQEREGDFLMDSNIIKVVEQFQYLITEAESKGTMDAEVKKKIETMYTAYDKFDNVTFRNKHLRLEKKLDMFVCIVIPAGLYNYPCRNLNAK